MEKLNKKSKFYYVIDKHYLDGQLYNLKKAFVTTNKEGVKLWKTSLLLGPTALYNMLVVHGKKLAEQNNTRLLSGIKNNQLVKAADYKRKVI